MFTALKTQRKAPKRIAFVTNTGGSTNFISYGPPNSSEGGAVEEARKAGFDVVLDLKYPPTVSDWGSIAAQVRAANPDFVWNSGLATDPVGLIQAMDQLNYKPPQMFTLFPAPGPLLALGDRANNLLSLTLFEPNGKLLKRMGTEGAEHRRAVRGAGGGEPAQLPRVRLAGDRVLDGVGGARGGRARRAERRQRARLQLPARERAWTRRSPASSGSPRRRTTSPPRATS